MVLICQIQRCSSKILLLLKNQRDVEVQVKYDLAESGSCWSADAAKCMVARLGLLKAHVLGLMKGGLDGDHRELFSFLSGDLSLCCWSVMDIVMNYKKYQASMFDVIRFLRVSK